MRMSCRRLTGAPMDDVARQGSASAPLLCPLQLVRRCCRCMLLSGLTGAEVRWAR